MRYSNILVKIILFLAVMSLHWITLLPESQGAEAWPVRYNGPGNGVDEAIALALDAQGNVYVTGYSEGVGSDYATIKYGPTGDLLWKKRYNGPGNSRDGARTLAVDVQGNAYVTGSSNGVESSDDYATIKYSPTGVRLWVRRYNGPGDGYDEATALALDAEGNVYVAGGSTGDGTDMDYAIVKYGP